VSNKNSKKKHGGQAAEDRPPRRRKPDALAMAQAEVDAARASEPAESEPEDAHTADADEIDRAAEMAAFVDAMAIRLAPAGSLVEMPAPEESAPEPVPTPVEAAAEFVAAATMPVSPPGPLVEMPVPDATAPAARLADLPKAEARALVGLGNRFHSDDAQVDVLADETNGDGRTPRGVLGLVRKGLATKRITYFITPRGAELVRASGVEVTKPVRAEQVST
jgi:hypothetical protein